MAAGQDIYEQYGIYRSPFRVFINKFSWTLSSGYGVTNYNHSLSGYYFFQDATTQQILSNDLELGPIFSGYENWFSDPTAGVGQLLLDRFEVPFQYLENPVNNPLLQNRQFLADADTLGLGFSNHSPTIPVMASLHFQLKKFRLGLGFQYERQSIRKLNPTVRPDLIRDYDPGFKKSHNTKVFGLVGYQFYQFWDYTFTAEAQLGLFNSGKEFNTTAIGIGQKFFANVGLSIENNISEYMRVVIRPSYDFKNYTVNLPDLSSLQHNNPGFYLQVGLSINIPEIPRSPMKSDHVQLKHVIEDPATGRLMEVRGQPMWKKQNPKVGENHRRLWRYKLKNRGKMDPY